MRSALLLLSFILSFSAFSQTIDTINAKEVSRIISKLASDSMQGRGNGTPDLLRAGMFIGEEFSNYGLKPLDGAYSYFQSYRPFGGSTKIISDSLKWNSAAIPAEQF